MTTNVAKRKFDVEIAVGIFIFVGIICLAYISVKLGKVNFGAINYYPVTATFTSVKGLNNNTVVEIAGVEVGKVKDIKLDNYDAVVYMIIRDDIQIHDDAIASIRTKGLLGEKYISLAPGSSGVLIEPGGLIFDTEPPVDLEKLIGSFVFDKVDDKEKK